MNFSHLDAPNHIENFLLLSHQVEIMMEYYFIELFLDFMIQSGDPNTIDGDPNTWGQGGKGADI